MFAAQVNEEASVVALTVALLTLVAAMDAAQCTGRIQRSRRICEHFYDTTCLIPAEESA